MAKKPNARQLKLKKLALKITSEHKAVVVSNRNGLDHAYRAGKYLLIARQLAVELGHVWKHWVDRVIVGVGERQERKYRYIARPENWAIVQTARNYNSGLSIDEAVVAIRKSHRPKPDDNDKPGDDANANNDVTPDANDDKGVNPADNDKPGDDANADNDKPGDDANANNDKPADNDKPGDDANANNDGTTPDANDDKRVNPDDNDKTGAKTADDADLTESDLNDDETELLTAKMQQYNINANLKDVIGFLEDVMGIDVDDILAALVS